MSEGGKSWGFHGDEIPKVTPVNKDGESRDDIIIEFQDIIELKLYENITQPVVMGELRVNDRGKFRIGNIMKEGYDYFKIEMKSNRSEGGTYDLMFEIVNISGYPSGHMIGGAYSVNTYYLVQFPAYRNLLVWNVSRGYNNKVISGVVEDIFETFLNTEGGYQQEIEDTDGELESFCIPFWNPYKTLQYLKDYAYTEEDKAGFHYWFDMKDQFHFKSLSSIFNDGDLHDIELRDIITTSIEDAQDDTEKGVKDYHPEFLRKDEYNHGLAGATSERFNWFKKKHYTLKRGYKERPIPRGPNIIYEKPEYINNMFGYHMATGYRWKDYTGFCNALVYNKMLNSIARQSQTNVTISGIIEGDKMKAGDKIKIKNMVQGVNENVEELDGMWFVYGVNHRWFTKGLTYTQKLALCRSGSFEH